MSVATSIPDERHDPTGRNDYLSQQHVCRYQFAAGLIQPGWRVLDIACGVGYGAGLLQSAGCQVIGVDYDPATIAEARRAFPYVHFETGDALALPFADSAFEAIVSFETVEHVHDGQAFLDEMKRLLVPGGSLIISTPNVRYTSHPAYHVKEYEPGEFFELVDRNFAAVEYFAQYFLTKDRLVDAFTRATPRSLKSLLEKAGVKQCLRALMRGESRKAKPVGGVEHPSPYAVVPFLGDSDNLRIMLCVARRPG